MKLLKKLSQNFHKYCESDEFVDKMMISDYFYFGYISGMFLNLKNGYIQRFVSIIWLFFNMVNTIFHMLVFVRSVLIVSKFNFTLLTFLTQLILIMQFCLILVGVATVKRQNLRRALREMVGLRLSYPGEDHTQILLELKAEDWAEKKRLLLIPALLCLIGVNCMLLAPVLDNWYGEFGFNRTESGFFTEVPIPLAYPWRISGDQKTFQFLLLSGLQLQTALFLCTLIAAGILTCINLTFAYNLSVKYLIRNLKDIDGRAESLFKVLYPSEKPPSSADPRRDSRLMRCYEICLKKNFRHHQSLIIWKDWVQDMFSIPVGSAYSIGTVVIALSLLSIKTGTSLPGTALTSTMTCALEVTIMAVISVLGQRMTDLNDDLRRTIYNIKWYSFNKKIKSDISIFQEVAARPVVLRGFGLVACSLDTFSNVMNTAYSYYNVINAF